jgi:excisionase family DNA binding protein
VQNRFLTLADVAEILNVSANQAYALVRRGDIRAIKVGGRGHWRIEPDEVERYIQSQYAEVAREIESTQVEAFQPGRPD